MNRACVEPFFKYHGLGNDFVVVDRRESGLDIDADTARALCDRRLGIGADGVLAILPDDAKDIAGRMVVHNADGSIAEMCGNGLRCVVKYLVDHGPGKPAALQVATGAGLLQSEISYGEHGAGLISVAMGPARLKAANLPQPGPFIDGQINGVVGTAVSMGSPHLVLMDTPPAQAARLGPLLEVHSSFSQRTNVEFCQPRPEGGLTVAVWERGVGLTQACGTGACAAVVAHALARRVFYEEWVPVALPGGLLEIKVMKDLSQVYLRGPATFVYEGTLP